MLFIQQLYDIKQFKESQDEHCIMDSPGFVSRYVLDGWLDKNLSNLESQGAIPVGKEPFR